MKRIISSVVGGALLILVIYFGGRISFFILAAIAAGICSLEIKKMFAKAGKPFLPHLVTPFTVFLLLPFYFGRFDLLVYLLFVIFLVLIISSNYFYLNLSGCVEATANSCFSVIYVSLCVGFAVLIRGLDDYGFLLFFVLVVTWSGDTIAFYTGSLFGKRPLAPAISPKKTIEGALGGLAGSMAGGLLIKLAFIKYMALADCLVVSLICGALGQLGDMVESMLKRGLGVKDSGSIMPGHGGLLDRIDGVMFSAPAFYIYYLMVIK